MAIVDDHGAIRRALEALREPRRVACPRSGGSCLRDCSRRPQCEALFAEYGMWTGASATEFTYAAHSAWLKAHKNVVTGK